MSRLRCVDVATLVERRPHGVPLEALERGLWYVGSMYAIALVCKKCPHEECMYDLCSGWIMRRMWR